MYIVHCVTVSKYERRHFHFEETQLNLQRYKIIYSSIYVSRLKMNSTKRLFIQNLVFLLVLHFFAIEQSFFSKSIEKVFLFCSDSSFISLIRNKSQCLSTFYGPLIYMKLQKKEKATHGQHDKHQGQTLFEVEIKIFQFATSLKYFLICLRLGKL